MILIGKSIFQNILGNCQCKEALCILQKRYSVLVLNAHCKHLFTARNTHSSRRYPVSNLLSKSKSQHVLSWRKCYTNSSLTNVLRTQHEVSTTQFISWRNQSTYRVPLSGDDDSKNSEVEDETEYGEYVREFCAIPGVGHRVLVIQPDIKTGLRRYFLTTRELKLEETCALVKTLPNWKVVEKRIVRTENENCKEVFGSGNFDILLRDIRAKRTVSAVVIGIDRLTGLQINTLQTAWGLPVYDRYMLVLQIFKDHAQSPEAKLQVALAEIPYIRSRLVMIHGGFDGGVAQFVGGQTEMLMEQRRQLLQRREVKLKKELEKLHSKRQTIRQMRVRNSIPTVAVVGYTNAGKTTLIKALTEDPSLDPQNHLFATLDVSTHVGVLASSMKVTYIDTVGFISDMPITLLDAFRATLEDALMADIILHIRDASHPDRKLQVVTVHNTLSKMLGEDTLQNMIEVYNKVDLISEEEASQLDPGILQISAVKGQGFAELGVMLEEGLLATTDHMKKTFRIPNKEGILKWLYQEAAVESALPDPKDGQFLIVRVIISKPAYGKFQARFTRKKPSALPNV
uniref:Hflx-type G domain-containing protein n=1 Tax=Arion vulgaris TaxID=1028688 RepID=A0A0B7AGD0_9EUPU